MKMTSFIMTSLLLQSALSSFAYAAEPTSETELDLKRSGAMPVTSTAVPVPSSVSSGALQGPGHPPLRISINGATFAPGDTVIAFVLPRGATPVLRQISMRLPGSQNAFQDAFKTPRSLEWTPSDPGALVSAATYTMSNHYYIRQVLLPRDAIVEFSRVCMPFGSSLGVIGAPMPDTPSEVSSLPLVSFSQSWLFGSLGGFPKIEVLSGLGGVVNINLSNACFRDTPYMGDPWSFISLPTREETTIFVPLPLPTEELKEKPKLLTYNP